MAERSRILALLVGLSALVVPLAGAATYYAMADPSSSWWRWPLPALGAASDSDLIGPTLLVGALALGVLASRRSGTAGFRSLGVLLIAGAFVQAVAFAGFGFELVRPNSGFFAGGGGSIDAASRWTVVARMGIQMVVCLVVIGFAGRFLTQSNDEVIDV